MLKKSQSRISMARIEGGQISCRQGVNLSCRLTCSDGGGKMIQQNRLDEMLTRLKLITIRDRLDNFLDEIARKDMDYK